VRPAIGRVAAALGIGLLITGCSLVKSGGPYPAACAQFEFSARRCAAIVARGLDEAGIDRSDVTGIDLLPLPEHAQSLGGGTVAVLRFHLGAGRDVDQEVVCVGISGSFDPACGEEARIRVSMGVDRDVPCSGEPPDGCATVPATPPPAAVTAASGLRVAELNVPIDHAGHYEIELGNASLPNGYLSERSLRLVDDRPATFWITNAVLRVASMIDGRPPVGSIYRAPYVGPEPVAALLVFDVTEFESAGILQVRDIVVR
jgi:hypothetical protein